MIKSISRKIKRDDKGVNALEFALCFPILIVFIVTGFDLVHAYFAKSLVNSELTRISRLSETGNFTNDELDEDFKKRILSGLPGSTIQISRSSFRNFSSMEGDVITFDRNSNGQLEALDCFYDKNGNGEFDVTAIEDDINDAEDTVYYKVVVNSRMLFFDSADPLGIRKVTATSLVRNQPFRSRANPVEPQEVCLT